MSTNSNLSTLPAGLPHELRQAVGAVGADSVSAEGLLSLPTVPVQAVRGQRMDNRERVLHVIWICCFCGDAVAILIALIGGFLARFHSPLSEIGATGLSHHSLTSYAPLIGLGWIIMIGLMKARRLHNRREMGRLDGVSIIKAVAYWMFLFLAVSLFLKLTPSISRLFVFYSAICMVASLLAWRWVLARYIIRSGALQLLQRNALVIGWNAACGKLHESACGNARSSIRIEGCLAVGDSDLEGVARAKGVTCYGYGAEQLEELLDKVHFDTIILANPDLPNKEVMRLYEISARHMADFMVLPSYSRVMLSTLQIETHGGVPILAPSRKPLADPFNQCVKRAFDIIGGIVGLVISAPIIAVFAWLVHRESPGAIFYRQVRTGRHGKEFKVIKIRSMRLDAEKDTGARWAVEDDPRRLKIGAFMRKWNIDELPQFWNILKGEMSLVGPRPERPELIADFKYSIEYYNLRHTVLPGLTGWAAVNGWRGDTCLQTRIEHDLEYIEHWSLWRDFYIMFRTFVSNKNAY